MNTSLKILIMLLLFLVSPLLLLTGINNIAEQASLDAYIPHNIWTYISAWAVMISLRGN